MQVFGLGLPTNILGTPIVQNELPRDCGRFPECFPNFESLKKWINGVDKLQLLLLHYELLSPVCLMGFSHKEKDKLLVDLTLKVLLLWYLF